MIKDDFQRVEFPKGKQTLFIQQVIDRLSLSEAELADLVGVHRRTFNGWKREECLMSLSAARLLSRRSDVLLPTDVKLRDRYWYTHKGAHVGWEVISASTVEFLLMKSIVERSGVSGGSGRGNIQHIRLLA